MSHHKDKPTWAILPASKLLPGYKALQLLGCVVSDIENPTNYCVPRDWATYHQQLPKALEVQETDTQGILRHAHASQVDTLLMKIFGFDKGQQTGQERQIVAQTVVTRFLADRRRSTGWNCCWRCVVGGHLTDHQYRHSYGLWTLLDIRHALRQ